MKKLMVAGGALAVFACMGAAPTAISVPAGETVKVGAGCQFKGGVLVKTGAGTLDLSAQGDPVYSPEKTPEPVEPSPSPEPNQTSEPGHTAEPSSTDEPSSTAKPENTPERTPGPTDAFSG